MEWINVKDRLPEEGSDVLAIIPKEEGGYYIPFECEFDGRTFFNSDGYNERCYSHKVTHWMPIPKPPTK